MITRALQSSLRNRLQTRALHSVGAIQLSGSTYFSFPATLYRYEQCSRSNLVDRLKLEEGDSISEGIVVSEQGLVCPGLPEDPELRQGAMLNPNTKYFQEEAEAIYEYYLDEMQAGRPIETHFVYSIKNGTPIPPKLTLLRDNRKDFRHRFYLQPSQPMPLQTFNMVLDEYYDKYANKVRAKEWLREHVWNSLNDDEADWMGR